ncbi:site-specific DNA-methyltransferase [bacterium]|nr:site-specific DNA-methyltransferase [bacterium]
MIGDALEQLRSLRDESVQCCITSPPYWGLRDYGMEGQLGLEKTPEEYIEKLVEIFREVRRVLQRTGTLWLNLGDSYASSGSNPTGGHEGNTSTLLGGKDTQINSRRTIGNHNLKPKDLIGIPWRIAFALQADGWYLRQDIIWSKPNPMPESVRDRCTKSHEYIFLLTNSRKYFYDQEAILERSVYSNEAIYDNGQNGMAGGRSYKGSGSSTRKFRSGNKERKYGDDRGRPGSHLGGSIPWEGRPSKHGDDIEDVITRNRRSVWNIGTEPFPEAHFATFPTKLVEPMIQAGTSDRGCCSNCGSPIERITESKRMNRTELNPADPRYRPNTYNGAYNEINGKGDAGYTETKTIGWQPSCDCNVDVAPCTILDPFCGSGTTGLVAIGLGRKFIGIELNPKYAEMAERRIYNAFPLLANS